MRRMWELAPLAMLLLCACAEPPPPAPVAPRHVVLLVLDATAAAHLSAYGGPADLTPQVDRLAQAGAVFERAFSNTTWTLPSTTSLLTGRYPEAHGVVTNHHVVPEHETLLAERLAADGWATAAFVQMVYASDRYGLDQGFAAYTYYASASEKRDDGRPVTEALEWLEAHEGERAFVYLHMRRPHSPYDPDLLALARVYPEVKLPEGDRLRLLQHADSQVGDVSELQPGELDLLNVLYRANLATVDARLAPLVDRVLARDDTLLILTADHGEGLGQHGHFGHGDRLLAEHIDIPLLFAGAAVRPGRHDAPACTVDVTATLLELTDVAGALALDGRSLLPALQGAALAPRPPAPLAGRYRMAGELPRRGLVDGRWKAVLAPDGTLALHDREDRTDSEDLAARHADIATRLGKLIRDGEPAAHLLAAPGTGPRPLPEDILEELRALGYR